MRRMRKTWICLLALTMILTLAALPVSAGYVTDEDTFTPVGRVEMVWDAKASEHLDVTDGDMSDWANAGYSFNVIMPENMFSWVGGSDDNPDAGMPKNWSISTYFIADADYLYIGFYTVDDKFVYAANGPGYDGDAFQFSVDFGGLLGKIIEEDPDSVSGQSNIFYSFACVEDGAPLTIVRQNSDNDGVMPEDQAIGSAMKTSDGWSAEFRISWQQLFDDFAWKAWAEDTKFYFGPDNDFYINCALYYISRDDESRVPTWAACSGNGELTWTPRDSGIKLVLPYAEDRQMNCSGVTNIKPEPTEPPTEVPTEPETTEVPTEAPTEVPTEAPTETPTEAPTSAPETEPEGSGCASSALASVFVLSACIAAVALKKKD